MRHIFVVLTCCSLMGAAHAGTVVPASPADQPPVDFPDAAGTIDGHVKLRFDIDRNGRVGNATILDSKPPLLFDKEAIEGVGRWTYHPRTVDGTPVEQPGNIVSLRFEPDRSLQPVTIFKPTLFYPRPAYEAKLEGKVTIGFDVTPLGRTIKIHVIDSTPPGVFDRNAADNVRSWLFQPGDPLLPATDMSATLIFRLKDAQIPPVREKATRPIYPVSAVESGISGYCAMEYWIEQDGAITDPKIVVCSPVGVFDKASLDSLNSTKFKPELDPLLNKRRHLTAMINYKIVDPSGADQNDLQPGQWIKLQFTKTAAGRAKDIKVIGQSDEGLKTSRAVEQLKYAHLTPALENGMPVEKRDQIMVIDGD